MAITSIARACQTSHRISKRFSKMLREHSNNRACFTSQFAGYNGWEEEHTRTTLEPLTGCEQALIAA
jgi:hypothetical protein